MRVRLAGKGSPIPGLALPDPNSDSSVPQIYLFADGEEFRKADWIGLGYTHFEVWCVGAAGGRGGGVADGVIWRATRVRVPMSNDLWAAYLRILHYWNDPLGVHYSIWDPTPLPGAPHGGYRPATMDEYYEEQFPNHDPYYVTTFIEPVLNPNGSSGGGGGGGGVHVVGGALATLPDVVVAEVGAVGADAPLGQGVVNGAWTPTPEEMASSYNYGSAQLNADAAALDAFRYSYPLPHESFLPPQPGGDGGASSFGAVAKAAGGKGGNPYKKWVGAVLTLDGLGGQGGAGDREAPGGGAAGAVGIGANGQDGTWTGAIGQGGGGGRIGHTTPGSGSPGFPGYTPPVQHPATSGGRGSFSYADTSVYGARQGPQAPEWTRHTYNYYTGEIQATEVMKGSVLSWPGGGGGVKALRKYPYGSRAPGFNPQGAVIIRIFKVE